MSEQSEKENTSTWTFGDKEYPLFVIDKTGEIGIPVMRDDKQVAILGATFAWETKQPFLDHLNLDIKHISDSKEDATERHTKNLVTQNQNLFKALVQSGYLVKVNEFGEKGEQIEKPREYMLTRSRETQSQLVDEWLGNFHIERFFPDDEDEIDALIAEPEFIWFTAKIGSFKNPTCVLLLQFKTPSQQRRESYENDTSGRSSKTEGDRNVVTVKINHAAKIKFATDHLVSVKGASIGVEGNPFVESGSYTVNTKGEDVTYTHLDFMKKRFNPNWLVRLADNLLDCFNNTGK